MCLWLFSVTIFSIFSFHCLSLLFFSALVLLCAFKVVLVHSVTPCSCFLSLTTTCDLHPVVVWLHSSICNFLQFKGVFLNLDLISGMKYVYLLTENSLVKVGVLQKIFR